MEYILSSVVDQKCKILTIKLSSGKYEETANLKMKNPDLKILLAIGGWTHGSAPFTALVANTQDMETFAANAIEYLRNINFDGLDLDWEYPANRGSPPEDKQRFTQLCKVKFLPSFKKMYLSRIGMNWSYPDYMLDPNADILV